MRQTVLNVVGSLPPQYFDVRINTVAESLAQLMLSIMTTGYMLRSAQFRMELQQSLRSLPSHSTATASGAAAAAAAGGATASGAGGLAAPTVAALSPASSGSLSRASSSGSSSSSGAVSSSDSGDAVVAGVALSAAEAEAEAVAAASAAVGTAFLYDGLGSPYAPGVQKKGVEVRQGQRRGAGVNLAAGLGRAALLCPTYCRRLPLHEPHAGCTEIGLCCC